MKDKKRNQELLDYIYSDKHIDLAIKYMKEQDDWKDFVKSMQILSKM